MPVRVVLRCLSGPCYDTCQGRVKISVRVVLRYLSGVKIPVRAGLRYLSGVKIPVRC